MTARDLEARLVAQGLHASKWGNGPGDSYAQHSHDFDKVLVAASGSITFHLPEHDRDVLLDAGERLELPAGTLHGATVGSGGVTCLEAHLPAGTLAAAPRHVGREW